MLVVLLGLAGLLLVPALIDFIRRADLRRVGVRNITRRVGEASLVVLGSALGTAIIAGALIIGDTFEKSVLDIARTQLGPIDEVIYLDDASDTEAAVAALSTPPIDGVDGVLSIIGMTASLTNADGSRAAPNVFVGGVDVSDANRFGADPAITGLADLERDLAVDEVIVNRDIADDLGVQVGDTVVAHAYGQQVDAQVSAITDRVGIGGFAPVITSPDLFTGVADALPPGASPPLGLVVVSNDGGVFDSVDDRDAADVLVTTIEDRLDAADVDHDASTAKSNIIDAAQEDEEEITEIFTVVGGFSVLAGVLLLINLFVMLAEERKPILGVLRAVGWRRSTLVRAFGVEGAMYALAAGVIGAGAGIGVGWVIVQVTRNIFDSGHSNFEFLLAIRPTSLLTAALIGIIISMAAIWLTSIRISRLNIISAIRDLPEVSTHRSRIATAIGGTALVVIGGALFGVLGLGANNIFAALAGPALAVLGLAILLKRWLRGDLLAVIGGIIVVAWGSFLFQLLPTETTDDVELPFFLLLGVVLVGAGTAISTTAGPQLRRLLDLGSRPAVAARLGFAYPVARTFRTAASLAMFSLIIFSLTFIAVMSATSSNQQATLAAENSAGRDIYVQSNGSNPIMIDELEALPGVASASPIAKAWAEWSAPFSSDGPDETRTWSVSGIEPDFATIGAPTLARRSAEFATDADVFAAVGNGRRIIVVPSWFLGLGGDDGDVPVGATVTLHTLDGTTTDFSIGGVVENDYVFTGVWMGADIVRSSLIGEYRQSNFYVSVDDGADAEAIATQIDADFVTNGADAETFTARIAGFLAEELGFYDLLAGYLALGLVIGIAGLGVTLVRAVRERRREIGMLRSMGLPTGGIRTMFLTEATFIGGLGVVTGILLGLLTSRQVITNSNALGEGVPFAWPLVAVAVIFTLPVIGALLAAAVPAVRAARLAPSEALRLAD